MKHQLRQLRMTKGPLYKMLRIRSVGCYQNLDIYKITMLCLQIKTNMLISLLWSGRELKETKIWLLHYFSTELFVDSTFSDSSFRRLIFLRFIGVSGSSLGFVEPILCSWGAAAAYTLQLGCCCCPDLWYICSMCLSVLLVNTQYTCISSEHICTKVILAYHFSARVACICTARPVQ